MDATSVYEYIGPVLKLLLDSQELYNITFSYTPFQHGHVFQTYILSQISFIVQTHIQTRIHWLCDKFSQTFVHIVYIKKSQKYLTFSYTLMQMCTHTSVIASLFLFSHTLKYKQLFLSRCQNATDTKSLFSEYWLLSSFKISHSTFPLFPALQFGCSFTLPITGIGLSPLLASEPWCSSCKHHCYWTNRTMGVIILIISYSNPMVKHSHTRSSTLCVYVFLKLCSASLHDLL